MNARLRRGLAITAMLTALLASTLGFVICRNQLNALDVEATTQWKQVENQLTRQHELLPKLAAIANRYAAHEEELLKELYAARAHYAEASERSRPAVAQQLDGVLVQALALAENYPDLKADQQFRELAYEITGTKNRIAIERMRYNEVVGVYNTRLRQYPWRLAASGFEAREFYNPPAETLAEPELDI